MSERLAKRASCLPVGLRVGDFEVTRELAAGTRHHVSRARHVGAMPADGGADDGDVVIKCLAPGVAQPERRAGLLYDEALLLMKLSHGGVRRCVQVLREPPAQVLEYLDGAAVADVHRLMLARGKRFSLAHALQVGAQVADALAYLGEHGVIHGDLGPDNVVLTRQGRAVLIDFTYGQWPGKRFVRPLQAMPKRPGYNSPEHWLGAAPTPTTDIFGLGAMLWELAAGRPPEHVNAPVEGHPLPPLASLAQAAPAVPLEMVALVDGMLNTDASRRPAADRQLVQRLRWLGENVGAEV